MRRHWFLIAILAACGTTKDCGGCGMNNSTTAEQYVQKHYAGAEQVRVTCITDGNDSEYLCSLESAKLNRNFRCADSADAPEKLKCIPWFPTE